MEFASSAIRQEGRDIALPDAGQFTREVHNPMGDQMHHLAFALDASLHGNHAGGEDHGMRCSQATALSGAGA